MSKIFKAFKCPHCKAPIYWAVKVALDGRAFDKLNALVDAVNELKGAKNG